MSVVDDDADLSVSFLSKSSNEPELKDPSKWPYEKNQDSPKLLKLFSS